MGRSGVQGACGAFKAASRRSKFKVQGRFAAFKVQGAFGAFKAPAARSRPLRGVQSSRFKAPSARSRPRSGVQGRFAAFKAPATRSRLALRALLVIGYWLLVIWGASRRSRRLRRVQGSRFKAAARLSRQIQIVFRSSTNSNRSRPA